jgi:hypothetical protein
MPTPRAFLGVVLAGCLVAAPAYASDPHGLAVLTTRRLFERRSPPGGPTPRSAATTDFAGTDLGCIVLPHREVHPYGYPGHAFVCEAFASGEVLGALLTSKGRRRCQISGRYTGDACYDLDFCGNSERLCVQ